MACTDAGRGEKGGSRDAAAVALGGAVGAPDAGLRRGVILGVLAAGRSLLRLPEGGSPQTEGRVARIRT